MIHPLTHFIGARIKSERVLSLSSGTSEFDFTESFYWVTALVGCDQVYILDSREREHVVHLSDIVLSPTQRLRRTDLSERSNSGRTKNKIAV